MMCDRGRAKGQCFSCDQDGNVQEARSQGCVVFSPSTLGKCLKQCFVLSTNVSLSLLLS